MTATPTSIVPNTFCHAVPPDWDNCQEVKLHISAKSKSALANIPKGEEHILEGIIAFDRISRKYFAIRHFPCFTDSFDCCCAAQAQEVSGPDSVVKWEPIEFPPEEDEA